MIKRKSHLSTNQRSLLIDLKNQGNSYRKIEKLTGIPFTTVKSVVGKYVKHGTVADLGGRGRKRKTTTRIDNVIKRQVQGNRKISAVQIANQLEQSGLAKITPRTVRNRLHEQGYNARIARKKPFLSQRHRKARLEFAKMHQDKPIEFWEKILWSDESKFNLISSDGPEKVWRKPGEAYAVSCMRGTVKFGGGNVMVWGCMTASGQGQLEFIDTTMNAEMYRDILEANLFQSADQLHLPSDFIFQQDNDPKHTAKLTKNWFEENGVRVLDWPAQSPDLNPIEHLWAQLENEIGDRRCKSKDQLKALVTEAWANLVPEKIRDLVHSMPRRLAAVIKSQGGPTKY